MKIICFTFLLLSLTICAYAQDSNTPSNVTVIEKKWRFQAHNPAEDESPFLALQDRLQVESQQRTGGIDTPNGKRTVVTARPQERKDGHTKANYIYEIKVKNDSRKAIRTMLLEYIFYAPGTQREVGRRKFLTKEKINSGKTRSLVFRSTAPPTGTIDANDAGKRKPRYDEQVIVQGIDYTDGSKWRATQGK